MIELEILKSNDIEVIGKHRFFFPKISLGPFPRNHIIIHDHQLKEALFIETINNQLRLSGPINFYYYHNDKKISGNKLIQVHDTFQLESTEIKLIQFDKNKTTTPFKIDLNNTPFQNNLEGEKLLESLEDELLTLSQFK